MEYATLKSRLMKKSVKGLNGIKRIEITKTYRMTYFSSAIVYPNDFEFPNLSSRLRVTQSRNGVRYSCDLWIKGIYVKRCLLRSILETRTLFFQLRVNCTCRLWLISQWDRFELKSGSVELSWTELILNWVFENGLMENFEKNYPNLVKSRNDHGDVLQVKIDWFELFSLF